MFANCLQFFNRGYVKKDLKTPKFSSGEIENSSENTAESFSLELRQQMEDYNFLNENSSKLLSTRRIQFRQPCRSFKMFRPMSEKKFKKIFVFRKFLKLFLWTRRMQFC